MADELFAATRQALLHRIATGQAAGRAPSLVGAVVRDGAPVWIAARGDVDGSEPTSDTQYRIGSISKTFVAVLVMRLRDEGRLDLADPLGAHRPGIGVCGTVVGAHARLGRHRRGAGPAADAAACRAPVPLLESGLRRARRIGRTAAWRAVGRGAATRGARTARDDADHADAAGSARAWLGGAPVGRRPAARAGRGRARDGSGRPA